MPSLRSWVLALALAGGLPFAGAGQERPPAASPVADLIRQLESDKFREREAAQRALAARDDASGAVRRALPTLTPEGQRRAKLVLETHGQRHTARFVRYARDGRIDLLVEWAAVADGVKSDLLWQGVLDVGWEIASGSLSEHDVRVWEQRQFPPRTLDSFRKNRPVGIKDDDTLKTALRPTHLMLRHSGKLSGQAIENSLVLAAGAVDLEAATASNIVFANGDVVALSADRVLVVADGNVDLKVCDTAVVIARGAVTVRTALEPDRTAVRADGGIKLNDAGQLGLLLRPAADAKPGQPLEAMNRVRFFELADLGLELAPRAGLKLAAVRGGSPLASGGVKPGDEVVSVNGDTPATPDALRQLLRRGFVQGRANIAVRRDGEPLTLEVSFAGWDLPVGRPLLK